MKTSLTAALLLVLAAAHASAYTKSNLIYTTDGSQADVQAAIDNSVAGNTVNLPVGTFTWGASGSYVNVNKAIRLNGAGMDKTFIVVSNTGGGYNGVCRIFAAKAVVQNMTFTGATGGTSGPFTGGVANGWRITNVKYNCAGSGYFAYCSSYGLIDNCIINNTVSAGLELIFLRGPSNSWQTPNSMGTADAVYVEKCTFNAVGYICDANANARICVRNCICNLEELKVDGHGKASNTPPRGVRQVESYRNQWTQTTATGGATGSWVTHELRGGTGMVWGNSNADTGALYHGEITLKEYSAFSNAWGNFNYQYQTLYNYPIDDQIGVGMDPKVAASEPMYLWGNTKNGVPVAYGWAGIAQGAINLYQVQLGYTTCITASATVGQAFTYDFGASNAPTLYSATGLPPGLTFSTSTTVANAQGIPVAVISGTPTTSGTYPVTLSAANGSDSMTAVATIYVTDTASTLPAITSVVSAYAFTGSAFSYQVTASNTPTSYAASNLPAGLTINTSTGLISGTVTAPTGTYAPTVSATNSGGTTQGVLTLRVFTAGTGGKLIICGINYTMQDIIKADRDYYSGDLLQTSFDGTTGVGTGTFAQMSAITPTTKWVGFWVTDQGYWDTTNLDASGQIAPSGQLYVWNGTAWVLKYTPYTYPHPLRVGPKLHPAS